MPIYEYRCQQCKGLVESMKLDRASEPCGLPMMLLGNDEKSDQNFKCGGELKRLYTSNINIQNLRDSH